MTIDWSRPIVTDAGKPIANHPLANVYGARNATPAEILAHPEVWPEWQDWAANAAIAEHLAANPQSLTQQTGTKNRHEDDPGNPPSCNLPPKD
jgi:hypothetical protein